MIMDFNKLIEFNNKHPDIGLNPHAFVVFNMLLSDDVSEEIIKDFINSSDVIEMSSYTEVFQNNGLLKITGDGFRDVSIRDLGLELIGQSKSDDIIEFATKFRELFPKGIKSGGYPVRSSTVDIADKLRKFFKKHKYTQEQVLEATKRYVERKGREGYSYMQQAHHFIEKFGVSNLAAECDNLKDEKSSSEGVDLMKRL